MVHPSRRDRLVLVAILAAGALSCASPGSPTRRAPVPGAAAPVEWVWSGAVTTTSAEVRARVPAGLSDLRLLVSTREDLSDPVVVPAAGGLPPHRAATFPVTGLEPDTVYHYAIESAQGRDPILGRFRTFSPRKSVLGPDQQAWLMKELAAAADARTPLVIWANTVPWITRVDAANGHGWEPYSRERRELADAIKRLGLTSRLVMVSGDAHMAAIDDGTPR